MLIEQLKHYIKKIDFEEGQPLVTVSFNRDWKILPNENFLVQSNDTLHLIASNKPNTNLEVLLAYIQENVDFNLEIVAKKEWVYKMSQKLKLMATELPLNELNQFDLVNVKHTNNSTNNVFDDVIGGYDDILPKDIKSTYEPIVYENEIIESNTEVPQEIPYHILAEIERSKGNQSFDDNQYNNGEWRMERETYTEE